MRTLATIFILGSLIGCGPVDQPPLGGPYGGSTDPTDPSNGDNGNGDPNSSDPDAGSTQQGNDSGTTQQQNDSGTTQQKDSGTTQTQDSGQQQQNNAPTWTQIFNSYMANGKEGRCASCHSQGSSATKLYSWLQGKGYINGKSSALVSTSQSCLSWYGGNMPPSGPNDAKAVSDMNAWAAAGAANN